MKNKYTYEDWRFGHVVLIESFIAANRKLHDQNIYTYNGASIDFILNTLPISKHWHYWEQFTQGNIVDSAAFDELAIEQINAEQIEIYNSQSHQLLENFKNDYSKRETNSGDSSKLIELEIKQCELIFFGGWRGLNGQYGFEWHNNFRVISANKMFDHVENHYVHHIVNGNPVLCTFIHTPLFNMNYELDFNIQSNACYQYYKWLKNKQEFISGVISNPRIFTSELGNKIFNAYFNLHLRKDQLYADISYLYYKMKGDYPHRTEYIHQGIKHNEFITFCVDHLSDKLNENQRYKLLETLQLKKRQREPHKLKLQFANLEKEITEG